MYFFGWLGQILELLEGLDAHVRQVSWKQQDSEDKMSCMMPALKEVLEEHKQFISSLKVKQLQDSKITTLQTALAEQVKLADKVFKQNDLTLCISKCFYIFGIFTDSLTI
jgi:hypothetical protein